LIRNDFFVSEHYAVRTTATRTTHSHLNTRRLSSFELCRKCCRVRL